MTLVSAHMAPNEYANFIAGPYRVERVGRQLSGPHLLRPFMPEVAMQVLHHGPNLLFERQIPEITTRLTTGDIETTVH